MKENIQEVEEWKDIIGFDGIYQASSFGRIKRLAGYQAKKDRFLKQVNNGNNYLVVCLCLNSKPKREYVHRIIAASFIENPFNKEEVNHIDGNRMNNNLSNLEWVTRSENHHHRYQVLKQRGVNFGKTGEKNWNSKMVGCFDGMMNLIEKYHGVMEASRLLKVNESSIRCAIYKGTRCKSMFWRYL